MCWEVIKFVLFFLHQRTSMLASFPLLVTFSFRITQVITEGSVYFLENRAFCFKFTSIPSACFQKQVTYFAPLAEANCWLLLGAVSLGKLERIGVLIVSEQVGLTLTSTAHRLGDASALHFQELQFSTDYAVSCQFSLLL